MSILAVPDVLGLIATTAMTYITIIALIRMSGKRSTSQMNNFDWVVTVTLGSISASMILLEDVTWAEGTIAMATLLLLQFGLTKAVRRFPKIARLVKPRPATLYETGEWNDEKMRRERVTRSEVLAAVRHKGYESLDRVQKVILETDATLSDHTLSGAKLRSLVKSGPLGGQRLGTEPALPQCVPVPQRKPYAY